MSQITQETMLKQLKNPFDSRFVKWRVGATNTEKTKGQAVAYIDAREVKKRLDDVCGLGGWQDKYIGIDKGFICELSLLIDGQWITKSDAAGYTNVEPVKGGASDALKRAASTWGIGRYLYYLPSPWVAIKPAGKSYTLAVTPELPKWALPGEVERWEDVAELEADASSGEEAEITNMVIENIDLIRNSTTVEELEMVVTGLSADQQLLLANEIQAKQRQLQHAANIHSDNS